ncbi:MAG: hypothetical protein PWQ82_528 [Thermosediminibacterales bacterium]|nr:hypothetical protein [Thermosediminibacterales bacterium]
MDSKQIERQLFILSLLGWKKDGYTANELHKRLLNEGIVVSQKTIRRDLDTLSILNFPIYEEETEKGLCFKLNKIEISRFQFTIEELISLYFLKEILSPVSNLPITKNAYNFISQIITNLPKINQKFIDDVKDFFKVDFRLLDPTTEISSEVLKALETAINERKVIKMKYYSFSSDTLLWREVEPYCIAFKNQNFYLTGFCRKNHEIRDFRISRIKDLKVKDETFVIDDGFSYRDYIKDSWEILKSQKIYHVKLKFSPGKARFIKEYYRTKAHKIEELSDGSIIFERRVAGLEEISSWVLSFGGEVEVIEPVELKEKIIKEAEKMAEIYLKRTRYDQLS